MITVATTGRNWPIAASESFGVSAGGLAVAVGVLVGVDVIVCLGADVVVGVTADVGVGVGAGVV